MNLHDVVSLSPERYAIAYERAYRQVEKQYSVVDTNAEAFAEALDYQLQQMVIRDMINEAVEDGFFEVDHVADDGVIFYRLTQIGKQILES